MPLPESWFGFFYDKDSGADLLVELEPEEFLKIIMDQNEAEADIVFLAAGAIFDLILNDFDEKAARWMSIVCERWPGYPWEGIVFICSTADFIVGSGVGIEGMMGAVIEGAHQAILEFFGGDSSLEKDNFILPDDSEKKKDEKIDLSFLDEE